MLPDKLEVFLGTSGTTLSSYRFEVFALVNEFSKFLVGSVDCSHHLTVSTPEKDEIESFHLTLDRRAVAPDDLQNII